MPKLRRLWVLAHRYVGLLLAGFLILEGVTGSILAYKVAIEQLLVPSIYATPRPGVAPLPVSVLAERVEAQEPRARVGYFSVGDRQALMHMLPRTDPATGKPYRLDFEQVFLDPWTGKELGKRGGIDLARGPINLMPFVWDVHQNLAVGPTGTLVLGVVAVLWTLDCFVAVYLTIPVSRRRFLDRWAVAWKVKWPSSPFRLNFDLHRAGGLWLWAALFVFAWSSVMFTLPMQVYDPVMGALFGYRGESATFAEVTRTRHPILNPKLDWRAAERAGAKQMAEAAARRGFRIERPYGMGYIEDWGVYTYAVASDRNIQKESWGTSLWLDGDTGALVELDVPAGQPAGAAIDAWMRALHFADLRDSAAYRLFTFLIGLAVAGLSVTGVYIWLKKRRGENARNKTVQGAAPRPGRWGGWIGVPKGARRVEADHHGS
jgi:uncharacterized iron-regulated membrane protein